MKQLDYKGMQCPMPIVHLSMEIRKLESGEVVEVEATDKAFGVDVTAWAEMTGNRLLDLETGEVLRARIQVA
ncbi:MAG: sulfurtransferase TusA family protein [Planctomycetota bacterium]